MMPKVKGRIGRIRPIKVLPRIGRIISLELLAKGLSGDKSKAQDSERGSSY